VKKVVAFVFAPALLHAADEATSAAALIELRSWLGAPQVERSAPGPFAKAALTKEDSAKAAALLWAARVAELRKTRAAEMEKKVIRAGGKEMKFEVVEFGSKADAPPGGRSLFISLHGGGNASAQLNDAQWENQVTLSKVYRAKEGIYVAPRAPTNTWNLWHESHIDPLFDRLIENFVALENVNPDRVFILGYSAGGDGVYQLAPRMADRWAAAAMMAGHPNETSPRGLRTVPFALQVGERDAAYRRNEIAAEWGVKLGELRAADPAGYDHFVEVHKGMPHWMKTADRKAIPWMEKFTRNPLPERIVWVQDDVTHSRSYWLAVTGSEGKAGNEVVATRTGQSFDLALKGAANASVLLNDEIANLDQPVSLKVNGREVFKGMVERTIAVLIESLEKRGDRRLMFSAQIP
jgi:poly(3-hydroxybutyrate) depolymerase